MRSHNYYVTLHSQQFTQNMKRTNPFQGLGIALVTPFHKDGSIDFEALERLVEEQITNGIDFLCVLGTTAETPCLDESERKAVIETVVRKNNERVPLLLGAGGNNTQAVIDGLKDVDPAVFSGVLIVCPYYNKPSQEGLYQHFKAVAEESPVPLVLYNVPGRTGVNLEAATTLRIAQACPNVVAIKEASGRITQIEEIIEGAPEGFEVLSGDDAITFELLTIGATGVISVVGNAYPKEFGDMVHAALHHDYNTSLRMHRKFSQFYKLLSADGNPAGIKALLSIMGKAEDVLRLPLVPATEATHKALQDCVAHTF